MSGLKAIGADNESQARFSIEYIQRKCAEALDAVKQMVQKPELLASNDGILPTHISGITPLKVAEHAEALGLLHKEIWKTRGDIHKCNLYGDRVFRDLKLPLPWDSHHIPNVRGMIPQLRESQDWQIVYTADRKFSDYKPVSGLILTSSFSLSERLSMEILTFIFFETTFSVGNFPRFLTAKTRAF